MNVPTGHMVIEIDGPSAEGLMVHLDQDTDLDSPFVATCVETGEALRFPTPWALDIAVVMVAS
mgnify:CR=1 FL=1|jgi:hypothetical protein